MSRGPGHVERHVLAALANVMALPVERRPWGLTYQELAADLYGVDEPTRAQHEAVARACRRIVARDDAYLHRDEDGVASIAPFLDEWHRKTHGAASRD